MATITTTELIETGEKRDTLGRRRTPVAVTDFSLVVKFAKLSS